MTNAIVAAGHELTAEAAGSILRAGGNAFDAAIGALYTACACEPALASLGGGGFLLAQPHNDSPVLIDFFSQTPGSYKPTDELDFDSFVCDFGSAQQIFHIGAGTCAVPGCVKGIFATHRKFGTMPMHELIQPACEMIKYGVEITSAQAYLVKILTPIFMMPSARQFFESTVNPGFPVQGGEKVYLPQYVDLLENLASDGDDLFYRGEVAQALNDISRDAGGVVTRQDLETYKAILRKPLHVKYRKFDLLLNPPPSVGGIRIAIALAILEQLPYSSDGFGSVQHLNATLKTLQHVHDLDPAEGHQEFAIDEYLLTEYRKIIESKRLATRGTTHISIIDRQGNAASVTISNGEGCGVMIPGTAVMMNNMLGEEDLNPVGLTGWPKNTRLSSMMCPVIGRQDNSRLIALGSGGSNRIPSAIQQVLTSLIDYHMSPEQAVRAPRVHYYDGVAYAENFFEEKSLQTSLGRFDEHVLFDERNVFFGGVHTVSQSATDSDGFADERRAGHCISVP